MRTAVILAGGLGTRLREVVSDIPKPMAPIRGRPFLAYQLDYWIAQGIERFVLSVGYKHELIVDFFGSTYRDVRIDYVVEPTPLGTGGGLLLALESIGYETPFLLLNGDTYFDVDLNRLIQFATEQQVDWTFSLFYTEELGRYMGIDIAQNGQITSFQSEKKRSLGRLVSGGVYWVNPESLATCLSKNTFPFLRSLNSLRSNNSRYKNERERCFLTEPVSLEEELLPTLQAAGSRLFGLECSGTFIDIGLPNDYHRSANLL